mmetsp:Transcript_28822/g.53983  ORF Transcript_28822/g.53983 Transcript_28822/m.53983 type:complete len:88 (+) Transcript_28822:659-922(+)
MTLRADLSATPASQAFAFYERMTDGGSNRNDKNNGESFAEAVKQNKAGESFAWSHMCFMLHACNHKCACAWPSIGSQFLFCFSIRRV